MYYRFVLACGVEYRIYSSGRPLWRWWGGGGGKEATELILAKRQVCSPPVLAVRTYTHALIDVVTRTDKLDSVHDLLHRLGGG
ncbi:hypothetical protein J6590_013137 [Homalodisca vitripennis]|nr:hypothetical protein J6590_013137 [Homalodisca vitripennis]